MVLLALLVALPMPLNYLAVIALLPLFRRRITWAVFRPALIAVSLVVYSAAFMLDFLTVAPPRELPPWWSAVVLAPLAEELIFRALAFAYLPPPVAWIFSVAIFGVLHPEAPLLAALYGLALALMYRGGGFAASVAMHAVNNVLWLLLYLG